MSLTTITAIESLQTLASFNTVIDARSPGEYSIDRLPGAVNWPSLSDPERILVGTTYKQVSAFEARKIGAALVAKNIAQHIEFHCADKQKQWKPLIYCWRGGKRSNALALILGQIGFDVYLLEGGYKNFRIHMLLDLEQLTCRFDYRVVCAPTGSGKTRLLQALQQAGAQVLDLEALAQHRSSVLGLEPGQVQPSQKQFDMRIWQVLKSFDPSLPVYVESESKKVGNVSIPEALMTAIRQGSCIRLDVPLECRVALLLEDYQHFVEEPDFFCKRLEVLIPLRGKTVVDRWQSNAKLGQMNTVVEDLLKTHYDPSYLASMERNFHQYASAEAYAVTNISHEAFATLAQGLLAKH